MSIQFDYNCATQQVLGVQHGIPAKALERLTKRAHPIHEELMRWRKDAVLGFYELPYNKDLVKEVQDYAKTVQNMDNFVVLGIGGSSLGTTALLSALGHPYYNVATSKERGKRPRLFVLDNSDPEILQQLIEWIDLKKTVFNVITKSGGTPETMAQFMVVVERLKRAVGAQNLKKHLIVTTDSAKGLLRPYAQANNLTSFVVPSNVGGRFSVFSAVGLVPAAVAGLPIEKVLDGARAMDKRCIKPDLMQNPAYLNGAIHYLADTKKGKSISVMMPYSNALRDIADWYRQLWAESLGKAKDRLGDKVFTGQTPVKALGATDQHSQVQLYVEGPNDKIFTLIQVKEFRADCKIPKTFSDIPELDFLKGHSMGALLNAELEATEFALYRAKRPSVRIIMDAITPENVGGLLYMLEVQTAFAGGLYNIDAFDQPGVEEGKKATAALMGRSTTADKKKAEQIAAFQKKKKLKQL